MTSKRSDPKPTAESRPLLRGKYVRPTRSRNVRLYEMADKIRKVAERLGSHECVVDLLNIERELRWTDRLYYLYLKETRRGDPK